MEKLKFKKDYSKYRKDLSNAYRYGYKTFCSAFDSNKTFRSIRESLHEKPVSIKIYLYLNK